jgi:hypothetical protein
MITPHRRIPAKTKVRPEIAIIQAHAKFWVPQLQQGRAYQTAARTGRGRPIRALTAERVGQGVS